MGCCPQKVGWISTWRRHLWRLPWILLMLWKKLWKKRWVTRRRFALATFVCVGDTYNIQGENEEDGREASEASSRLSPYVLENETGYPLWYKLSHSREMVRIKAGESTPLAMSDSQRGGQRARLGVETLSVRIEAPEFTIDEGLPIERVGCYRLRVSDMNVATHEVL